MESRKTAVVAVGVRGMVMVKGRRLEEEEGKGWFWVRWMLAFEIITSGVCWGNGDFVGNQGRWRLRSIYVVVDVGYMHCSTRPEDRRSD